MGSGLRLQYGASPFQPALNWIGLPEPLRRQFLVTPGRRVRLEGIMRHVWHRPFWLGLLLWIAAQGEMLFPEQGKDVPVTLTIAGGRDAHGLPFQKWSRRFKFRRARRFDTVVAFDAVRSRIVDRVGPGRLLVMESVMEWRSTGELVMRSTGWSLRVGGLRLGLPSSLFGRVTAVQTVSSSEAGRMRFEMTMNHPLLGDIFGYEGTIWLGSEEAG